MSLADASATGSRRRRSQLNTHASDREFERFVAGLDVCRDGKRRILRFRSNFVEHYPDLAEWFERPLLERVGWRYGQSQKNMPETRDDDPELERRLINHHARYYLSYLGFTGRIRLDWGWLLGVGILKTQGLADALGLSLTDDVDVMLARQVSLGHSVTDDRQRLNWAIPRLLLHNGFNDIRQLTSEHVHELRTVVNNLGDVPELDTVLSAKMMKTPPGTWQSSAFQAGVALFHAGLVDEMPLRNRFQPKPPISKNPKIETVLQRYVQERTLIDRPETVAQIRQSFRRLATWIELSRPEMSTLAEMNRDDALEFMTWVKSQKTMRPPIKPISPAYVRMIISQVGLFFRNTAEAGWEGVPTQAPMSTRDVPRMVTRVPRSIPPAELEPLLAAIRELECPLQRCALLVARWSGARRGEILKLHMDCLSAYPDGTPRLRLAAGKSRKERMVPLHQEAADAIKQVLEIRRTQQDRPIHDPDLGYPVRYLFLNYGRLPSEEYLFVRGLESACAKAGLLRPNGRPQVHPHRFRHTIGTELGEKGARLQTIMKVLGHQSAGMSMTYINMTDPTVLADYASVLTPGAVIAGPQADAIRNGGLSNEAVDWLKTNFLKTELELGRCLRLPQEGPCECDLYLTCSKFVTTPAYAGRLRARVTVEEELICDAEERGRVREVERHQRIRARIIDLLTELNEPIAKNSTTKRKR